VVCLFVAFAATLGASNLLLNEVSHRGENWVEIYNPSYAPVDLEGYRIANSMSRDRLDGRVPGYGYLVVTASERQFRHAFPEATVDVHEVSDGDLGSGLNPERDMLILVDPSGAVVDLVNWGNPDPSWPNFTSLLWFPGVLTQDLYLARMPNGKDSDQPTDFTGMFEPTPGDRNPAPMGLSTASWGKIKALFSGNSDK
jgi:hypothetical protein